MAQIYSFSRMNAELATAWKIVLQARVAGIPALLPKETQLAILEFVFLKLAHTVGPAFDVTATRVGAMVRFDVNPKPTGANVQYIDPVVAGIAVVNTSATVGPLAGMLPDVAEKAKAKIPRPPNAWILFRQHFHASVKADYPGASNNEISKIISGMWHNLEKAQVKIWQALADQRKAEHGLKYPGYAYRPRKAGEKKRRMTKKKMLALTQAELLNKPSVETVIEAIAENNVNVPIAFIGQVHALPDPVKMAHIAKMIETDGHGTDQFPLYPENYEMGFAPVDPEDDVSLYWNPPVVIPGPAPSFTEHPTNPELMDLHIDSIDADKTFDANLMAMLNQYNARYFGGQTGEAGVGQYAPVVAMHLDNAANDMHDADCAVLFGTAFASAPDDSGAMTGGAWI